MSKLQTLCILFSGMLSSVLPAQEQRWFEIEMLIFSQTPASKLQENFADTITPIKPGRAVDLLTPRYQPDIRAVLAQLPLCLQQSPATLSDSVEPAITTELCIAEQQPQSWQQGSLFEPLRLNSTIPYPAQLDYLVTGNGTHQDTPYLADTAALQLTDIANKIRRQSGHQLLIHTAWRQAPVTERRAIASRWYSGSNYSAQFDYWGQPLPTGKASDLTAYENTAVEETAHSTAQDNDMLQHIDQLLQLLHANSQLPEPATTDSLSSTTADHSLSISTLPDQVWQLDGLFKLHLDHYLFVHTEFNLRKPLADKLQSIHVRQSRRVISGEIHYLDHPYLGIVLQIRRYEPPPPATDENVTADLP